MNIEPKLMISALINLTQANNDKFINNGFTLILAQHV